MARELSEDEEDAQQLKLGGGKSVAGGCLVTLVDTCFAKATRFSLFESRHEQGCLFFCFLICQHLPGSLDRPHSPAPHPRFPAEFQRSQCLLHAEVIDVLEHRQQIFEDNATTP